MGYSAGSAGATANTFTANGNTFIGYYAGYSAS